MSTFKVLNVISMNTTFCSSSWNLSEVNPQLTRHLSSLRCCTYFAAFVNDRCLRLRCYYRLCYSGNFFNSAWRQFRKRNAYPTAITQNVEYLLDSVQASTMLSNSEFIVMLNQAASDREKLARLLNISNEQMSYVTNADAGCGLIKYGSALVPFVNRFPKDTQLYKLMTTKPGEGVFGGEGKEVTA